MKKYVALLLALLLLSGCAGVELPTVPPAETAATGETAESTAAPETTEPPTAAESPVSTEPVSTELPVSETVPAPETTVPVTVPAEPVDPWSLIGVSFFDQGYYEDEYENGWTWSYELPRVEADTPGAREINAEIDAGFGRDVREAMDAMEQGSSLGVVHIGFRGEVWEDVLTLVVMEDTDWGFTGYGVYCYDCSTGKRLDTPALLEKLGYTQEEFLEAATRQTVQYYKDLYSGIPKDQRSDYGYDTGLSRMESGEFTDLKLMTYPDPSGDLVIVAPIVSLAGADYYYHEIHLGMGGVG